MVRPDVRTRRLLSLCATAALVVAACGGTTTTPPPGSSVGPGESGAVSSPTGAQPKTGGTIYILDNATGWDQIDPQRAYTGEDLAFFSATIYRSLESYVYDKDPAKGTGLQPDMATDLGTPSDGGKTWTFTLRDGLTWQDGSPVTCADLKYGVSRTFATDVINQGPTYAIQYLDIPYQSDGQTSQYPGPYKATAAQQAMFDKAVTCSADGKTVTFHLNSPHGDFNYTTTLGFGAVPNPKDHPGIDSGESYGQPGHLAWSDGPYMFQSYSTGNGGKAIFVRNPKWNKASDPIRPAYPDSWEFDWGLDLKVIDQRVMASSGQDATAINLGVQPENLPTVFTDPNTPTADYTNRAIGGFDPYTRYIWINVQKVKDVNVRLAMAAALDRDAERTTLGGAFYGDFADGALKPNIGPDYAPTGFWTASGPYGKDIPATGDPDVAKSFLAKASGAKTTFDYNFADTPTRNKEAASIIQSMARAGITVNPKPIDSAHYYSTVFDPTKAGDMGYGGWGADWPNGSTVIAPLFTQKGGWDLSQVNDSAFNTAVDAAVAQTDRTQQESQWQALNKQATNNVWIIPTFFGETYYLAGNQISAVDGLYRWAAYGSWPYAMMYVTQ